MSKSKGVRELQRQRTLLIAADRERGLTWGQIALKYGLDRSGARRMALKLKQMEVEAPKRHALWWEDAKAAFKEVELRSIHGDGLCHICGKPKAEAGLDICSYPHAMFPDKEVAPGMMSWTRGNNDSA